MAKQRKPQEIRAAGLIIARSIVSGPVAGLRSKITRTQGQREPTGRSLPGGAGILCPETKPSSGKHTVRQPEE